MTVLLDFRFAQRYALRCNRYWYRISASAAAHRLIYSPIHRMSHLLSFKNKRCARGFDTHAHLPLQNMHKGKIRFPGLLSIGRKCLCCGSCRFQCRRIQSCGNVVGIHRGDDRDVILGYVRKSENRFCVCNRSYLCSGLSADEQNHTALGLERRGQMTEELPRKIRLKTASDVECRTGQRRKPDGGCQHDRIAVGKVIIDRLHSILHRTSVMLPAIPTIDTRRNVVIIGNDTVFPGKPRHKRINERLRIAVLFRRAVDDERFQGDQSSTPCGRPCAIGASRSYLVERSR